MTDTKSLLLLPGDGIGPEVMEEVKRVITWLEENRTLKFDIQEDLVGGAAYDAHKVAVTDACMEKALSVDAVIFGAVGGPQWADVPYDARPEAGLLRLRKDLDLYANLRPAICFDALVEASSLKPELVSGLDILIVRELTSGVYFGEPKMIETLADGSRRAVDTQSYTTDEVRRIARIAFELAEKRDGRVTSCEKNNVMKSGLFWKEEVQWVYDNEGWDGRVSLAHHLADSAAMELVRKPKQFDVMVMDNLFGDVLSDIAAMLTGSLGMLPSASLGPVDENGKRKAMYEPVHGSAPDIAGENKANPIAMILSFAMALRYSFDLGAEADLVEKAVTAVLDQGLRTGDIMQDGKTLVTTTDMGAAITRAMTTLAN